MERSWMIIDGQWGSTGKGLIAGYLARRREPDGVVCNFGPNAGHTFVFTGGSKVMTRQLPTGIVAGSVKKVFIGPGSIIDPEVLEAEIREFAPLLDGVQIFIHERAAVVGAHHKEQERAVLSRISSTQKGTGAAMAAKTMRLDDAIARHHKITSNALWVSYVVNHDTYMRNLVSCRDLQIESAQGYELGLCSGSHYPYCTGRDITPAQVLADCGVPLPLFSGDVIATMRTLPIRVGDQFDGEGKKIGTSGPVYDDQHELTWEEIGVPHEKTTVTGKTRRVFTFSDYGTERMLRSVMPSAVFLNFVNYLDKSPTFMTPAVLQYMGRIHQAFIGAFNIEPPVDFVKWIGTGPQDHQVLDYTEFLQGRLI